MAVNTAGQGARPNPAFSNAARARMSSRPSPQSGGDVYGVKFLKGTNPPTSRGRIDNHPAGGESDHHFENLKTTEHAAHQNAEHLRFAAKRGNSEGRAEVGSQHVT